jgi:hypothetical protein
VGGIVVAGGAFGPVTLKDNVVVGSVVTGGFLASISIHDFGPGVMTGTEIFSVPGVGTISGTQPLSATVSNDHYTIWHAHDVGARIANPHTSGVTAPVFP